MTGKRRDVAGLTVAVAAWLAGLLLVSVLGDAVVVQRAERPAAPVVARTPATVVDDEQAAERFAPGPFGPTVPPLPSPAPIGPADDAVDAPDEAAEDDDFDFGLSDPVESTPPPPSILPPFPGVDLPPLPAELAPVLSLVSPTVRQACALTGIAVIVVGLVKADVEEAGVPVTAAMTYLAPVFAACALFPEDEPSACAFEAAINEALIPEDLRLIVGIPSLGGLALDQIQAVENVLAGTGLALPDSIAAVVAEAMGCDLR